MDNLLVGNYIRQKIKEKGITQEELAEQLGISASAVSQNLAGKSTFDISNLMLIAELLGDTLDNIVRGGQRTESELEKSIKKGIDMFISLVKNGFPIKEKDSNGNYAIDYAISFDKIEIVKYILDNNLYQDGIHEQPNLIAFLLKNELINYLKKQYYTNNNVLDKDRIKTMSSIVYPTFFKERNQIDEIISKGESIIDNISKSGFELIDAILKCKNNEIRSMIPYFHRQRYEQIGNDLLVLIVVAIERDNLDSLKFIWDFNNDGLKNQLMMYAIKRKSINVTLEFMKLDSTGNTAMKLVESDDHHFFKILYDKTNKNDLYITEALKLAVNRGNEEIVKHITESCSEKAKSLALESVKPGDISMVKVLLDSGAKFTYCQDGTVIPLETISMVIKHLLSEKSQNK